MINYGERVLNIKEIISSNKADTDNKAKILIDKILETLRLNYNVSLDFNEIESVNDEFLNCLLFAIYSYFNFDLNKIKNKIRWTNIKTNQKELLDDNEKLVLKRSRESFISKLPKSLKELTEQALNKELVWVKLEDSNDWKEFCEFIIELSNDKYEYSGISTKDYNEILTEIDGRKEVAIGNIFYLSSFGFITTLRSLNDSYFKDYIKTWKQLKEIN